MYIVPLNNRMAYVSVSRGQWDAQIFTNDRGKLSQALGHDVSHKSAHMILAFWFGPPTAVKFGPLGRHWLGFMDGSTEA